MNAGRVGAVHQCGREHCAGTGRSAIDQFGSGGDPAIVSSSYATASARREPINYLNQDLSMHHSWRGWAHRRPARLPLDIPQRFYNSDSWNQKAAVEALAALARKSLQVYRADSCRRSEGLPASEVQNGSRSRRNTLFFTSRTLSHAHLGTRAVWVDYILLGETMEQRNALLGFRNRELLRRRSCAAATPRRRKAS